MRMALRLLRWQIAATGLFSVLLAVLFIRLEVGGAASALPVYGRVPAFSLTNQAGRPVTLEMLRGDVWIADFIFTRCAGQCPMMTAQMSTLAQTLRSAGPVTLVSFTVDPEWDTPAVLSQYATTYAHTKQPWHFLTGPKDDVLRLCTEGFKLAAGDGQGTSAEPITHSVRLVLIDRQARIRGYYDATDAAARNQLRRDVQALVKERS